MPEYVYWIAIGTLLVLVLIVALRGGAGASTAKVVPPPADGSLKAELKLVKDQAESLTIKLATRTMELGAAKSERDDLKRRLDSAVAKLEVAGGDKISLQREVARLREISDNHLAFLAMLEGKLGDTSTGLQVAGDELERTSAQARSRSSSPVVEIADLTKRVVASCKTIKSRIDADVILVGEARTSLGHALAKLSEARWPTCQEAVTDQQRVSKELNDAFARWEKEAKEPAAVQAAFNRNQENRDQLEASPEDKEITTSVKQAEAGIVFDRPADRALKELIKGSESAPAEDDGRAIDGANDLEADTRSKPD